MTHDEFVKAASFWDEKSGVKMDDSALKREVYDYLTSASVCALATGSGDYVRCTPLEYSFHDGAFWIFTEGGHKFISLEKNSNVSLAVFDNNPSFESLRSVQVTGWAEIVEPFSEKYLRHAEYRKIPLEALRKLSLEGHPMYLIAVHPIKADVLFSSFKKAGFDPRETLVFKSDSETDSIL